MDKIIEKALKESVKVKEEFVSENSQKLVLLAEKVAAAFTGDRKLMLCGNGGSAADAQHIAAEFVNRFVMERPPLPAIALTTDTSILTSISNDYSFEEVFSKQIKALGMKGDVLLALSTSGNSPNILSAVKTAKKMGIYCAALIGGETGRLAKQANLALLTKGSSTPRIQETHIFAGHLVCQLVDHILFNGEPEGRVRAMTDADPISLDGVRTYSLKDRKSKVQIGDFGRAWTPGGDMRSWLRSLPNILGAESFTRVVNRLVQATRADKMVILAMGAHAIKVGLNPILLDLMERGVLKGLAMNGACIIHDAEIAMAGHTSEDVSLHLGDGTFGMAEETGRFLNQAIREGAAKGHGLGRAVGAMLVGEGFPHNRHSLLAGAYERNIPVTVHVALGTDIIHGHPGADGAAIGKASHLDFRIFAGLVSRLEGGVFINLGSAVILPEVFLKALSLVRNLGHEVKRFTAVNMDFIRQYRPLTNVVERPTLEGGEGYNLVGHHEIMLPLLAAAVLEGLEAEAEKGKE